MNVGKAVGARGSSEGLATLWSEEKFHLNIWFATQHWIFTNLYHYSSKISLELFNLYVPVNYSEKRECWKSLSEYIESISPSNLVLTGDLNITLAPSEKKRRAMRQRPSSRHGGGCNSCLRSDGYKAKDRTLYVVQ